MNSIVIYYLIYSLQILIISICIKIAFCKKYINIIVNMSLLSLLLIILYCIIDAPDVAMTEICIGSGFSTLLSFLFLKKIKDDDFESINKNFIIRFILCFIIILSIIIGVIYYCYSNIEEIKYLDENNLYKNAIVKNKIHSGVAAILAFYRGFDTYLETCVIFLSSISCYYIFSSNDLNLKNNKLYYLKNNKMLFNSLSIIIPYIIIFILYIHVNGIKSPGGGFQSGILLSSVFIFIMILYPSVLFCNIEILNTIGINSIILYTLVFLYIVFSSMQNKNVLQIKYFIEIAEFFISIIVFSSVSSLCIIFHDDLNDK